MEDDKKSESDLAQPDGAVSKRRSFINKVLSASAIAALAGLLTGRLTQPAVATHSGAAPDIKALHIGETNNQSLAGVTDADTIQTLNNSRRLLITGIEDTRRLLAANNGGIGYAMGGITENAFLTTPSGARVGVLGSAATGTGVLGTTQVTALPASATVGVRGRATTGVGVLGEATAAGGTCVRGDSSVVGVRGIEFIGGGVDSHIPFSDGQVYLTGDRRVGATGTGDFIFRTFDGATFPTLLRVKGNTGNVGIGTDAPVDSLHVVAPPGLDANVRFEGSGNVTGFVLKNTGTGGRDWRIRANKNTILPFGGLVFQVTTSPFPNMVIDASGNVGIGTSTPSPLLHVNGPVNATAFNNISDLRLKHDVAPLTDVLERLEGVSGVSFQWNHSDPAVNVPSGRQIGLIAQEVEQAFPELVSKWAEGGAEDYRGVDYGRFTAVLLEAVKELNRQVSALTAELAELRQSQNS